MTVSAGNSVELGCETDMNSRIRWIFKSLQQAKPRIIYSGYSVGRTVAWRVAVDETSHGNKITINSLVTEDSGVYSCHDIKNFSRKVEFYLLVKGRLRSTYILSRRI